MKPSHAPHGGVVRPPAIGLIVTLVLLGAVVVIQPPAPTLNAEVLFEDEAKRRLDRDGLEDRRDDLVLRIHHDHGGSVTSNLTRIQTLIELRSELLGAHDVAGWGDPDVEVVEVRTAEVAWLQAFESRGRDLENAQRWADVLQPTLEGGWCGENATAQEARAFQETLILLPSSSRPNVACPSLPGSSAGLPPVANEVLWIVHLDSPSTSIDSTVLVDWAEVTSARTEFTIEATGVSLLFEEAKDLAIEDLRLVLYPSFILLMIVLWVGLRDPLLAAWTLLGVGAVMLATMGTLILLGRSPSVVDAIALPIVMGVAVDGAFWYVRSSRSREEVRSMLFVAMLTTEATVGLAVVSPIRIQQSLGLAIAIGIALSWCVSRVLLEPVYLRQRRPRTSESSRHRSSIHSALERRAWSGLLMMLALLVLLAPPGVTVASVESFLPADSPSIDALQDLEARYLVAATAPILIVADADPEDPDVIDRLRGFEGRIATHPEVIALDTGLVRRPLISGLPADEPRANDTLDAWIERGLETTDMADPRLQQEGRTTGIAFEVLVDSRDADAALEFGADLVNLLEEMGIQGVIGGDLYVGAVTSAQFESTRIVQVLLAGGLVTLVASTVLQSPMKGLRIGIGAIAVGAGVDALAGVLVGRSMATAPAVLLGMGFAADYLTHASEGHGRDRGDTEARWWAGLTSVSVFVLIAFAAFPPARSMGILLSLSILVSLLLASALTLLPDNEEE